MTLNEFKDLGNDYSYEVEFEVLDINEGVLFIGKFVLFKSCVGDDIHGVSGGSKQYL